MQTSQPGLLSGAGTDISVWGQRWADIVGGWPDKPIVLPLFQDMGRPTNCPANGKNRSEQFCRNVHGVVQRRRKEIHIGIYLGVAQHGLFHFQRNLKVTGFSSQGGDLTR